MRLLMQCKAIRSVCYVLIMALVSTVMPAPFATPANAQLLPTYAVAVVDFVNETSIMGDSLARLATDATVVEMSKTNRYDVSITRNLIKDAMTKMDVRPPLDKVNLIRLGEEVSADAVLQGAIKSVQLAGSGVTRRAQATIVVQMIDQMSGEIVNGAVQTGTSEARVGFTADDDALVTEAISKAAFLAVKTMVDYVMPEATVQINIGADQVLINRGVRDGFKPGMRLIAMRAREIIGYLEIREVHPNESVAKIIKSMRGVQPEDKVRAIFDMPMTTISLKSAPVPGGAPEKSRTGKSALPKIGRALLALAIIGGFVSLFKGGRGGEGALNVSVGGPLQLTWDHHSLGEGVNVLELQVLRDTFTDGTAPVRVLRDPSSWDLGKTDLKNLYGLGADATFEWLALEANPDTAYTATEATVPPMPFGTTHYYQVRVLYQVIPSVVPGGGDDGTGTGTDTGGTGAGNGVKYYYTPLTQIFRMTAIEPVTPADILSPRYEQNSSASDLLISDLADPTSDLFSWNAKDGADEYYVAVEPANPAVAAPPWHSNIIKRVGPTVKLSLVDRLSLAAMLKSLNDSPRQPVDTEMIWRVYSRNSLDTAPKVAVPSNTPFFDGKGPWTTGEDSMFNVIDTPPGQP